MHQQKQQDERPDYMKSSELRDKMLKDFNAWELLYLEYLRTISSPDYDKLKSNIERRK